MNTPKGCKRHRLAQRLRCRLKPVKLQGDEEGIELLKALHAKDKEYLKMLIAEARTNSDRAASFRNEDGSKRYVLRLIPQTGEMVVEPA